MPKDYSYHNSNLNLTLAYSGYTIIRAFAGSIKSMQEDTETTWARDSAAEEARINREKNMAAGGLT